MRVDDVQQQAIERTKITPDIYMLTVFIFCYLPTYPIYASSPAAPPVAEPLTSAAARRRSTMRPADGAFLFTDLTGVAVAMKRLGFLLTFLSLDFFAVCVANEYMEWNCVKTNKYGRRQNRVIGVDGTHIFNKRPAGNRANVRCMRQLQFLSNFAHVFYLL